MTIMFGGIILAGIMVLSYLPKDIGLISALKVAGKMDKLNIVTFNFDINDRYNIWSGLLGGFFLALSYFGTDQSQVQRYLTGRSITESRLGLLMNGMLKIPFQFIILFIGVLIFLFYQFNRPPLFFNESVQAKVYQTEYSDEYSQLDLQHQEVFNEKKAKIIEWTAALDANDEGRSNEIGAEVNVLENSMKSLEKDAETVIGKALPNLPTAEKQDRDYVFISFIMKYMPKGIIGLLLAMILSAAMSSTSSELNALGSTTTVDIYKRNFAKEKSERHYLRASRWFTFAWGAFAISFAAFAGLLENLIQAVNILGSLFYGTILGIFVVAFYVKWINGTAVFIAAIIAELFVLYCFFFTEIAYLNFNLIGCAVVVFISIVIQKIAKLQ